jgi:hypothetical protein
VNCAAYVLLWVCELYPFGCRQFLELLRSELFFLYLKKSTPSVPEKESFGKRVRETNMVF